MKKSIFIGLLSLAASLSVASTVAAADVYQIKKDDTLAKIEKAQNLPSQSLQTANPNLNPMNLQIGSTITLPNTYTAVEGETLWTIAKKLNFSSEKLQALNPNVDPQNIQGGTVLVLPEQKKASKQEKSAIPAVKTASGKEIAYKHIISSKATAYSAAPEENGGLHGVDYFGNKLKVGTIAVDPKVIPLGSKVYITGYSFPGLPEGGMIAKATDIGGSIKNHRVDIFVPGAAEHVNKFGVQNVKIYVLK